MENNSGVKLSNGVRLKSKFKSIYSKKAQIRVDTMQIYRLHNLYKFFLPLSISSTPAQVP